MGQRRRSGAVVRFPARPARCFHLVFAGPELQEWAWLDPTELADRARSWLDERADARLCDLVHRLVDRGEAVIVEVLERPPGPALPAFIGPAELGDASERLDAATSVLRVEAGNPAAPGVGFPGLWCAFAVAGAAARASGGVWLDAGALRMRGTVAPPPQPGDGTVRMGDHLLLARAGSGDGGELSSTGLGAFGLPELLLAGVPQSLGPAAAVVLQGLAQRLTDGLVDDLRDAARTGELPAELVVTGAHVLRAAPAAKVRETGAARVRLAYRLAEGDDAVDHLSVEPVAADERRPRPEWLRLLLAELLAG